MSMQEILDELPRLAPPERDAVARRLRELSEPKAGDAELVRIDGRLRILFHQPVSHEMVRKILEDFP